MASVEVSKGSPMAERQFMTLGLAAVQM